MMDFGFSQLKPANKHLKDMFGPRGTALYMPPGTGCMVILTIFRSHEPTAIQ